MKAARTVSLSVPFGLKEGRLVYVRDVPPGIGCGCICPECHQALVARNVHSPNRKRAFHFQHARLTNCTGGREGAIHKMAKSIVQSAEELGLPAWRSGNVSIPPLQCVFTEPSQLEVTVAEGRVRADARVIGRSNGVVLRPTLVEIRVRHAVDWEKQAVLRRGCFNSIEIDLSRCSDDELVDAEAFRDAVLVTAPRCWIHLGDAAYIVSSAGTSLIEISMETVKKRMLRARSGTEFPVYEQSGVLHQPGSYQSATLQLPDESVGEQPIAYPAGLYTMSPRSFCVREGKLALGYKTYLDEIEMDPEEITGEQVDLFAESKTSITETFRVRHRNWRRSAC